MNIPRPYDQKIHSHTQTLYHTLLEVSRVLNFQQDIENLLTAIAGHIKQIVSWERVGITLYHSDIDAFRFYALETSLPIVRLKGDAVIPRKGSALGWVYVNKRIHVRPHIQKEPLFLEDRYYQEEGLGRMINLPLMVGDNCLGSLNIGSIESGNPDSEDIEFLEQVAKQIASAVDHVRANDEIRRLRNQLSRGNASIPDEIKISHDFGAMVGKSEKIRVILDLAQAVAPTNSSVLITGETGTGKELLARFIHELSPRSDKPFIRVNCASLPSGLVESELFGHEKGAFTGAEQPRPGKFELANGGSLFLDEIGEMPLEAQAKVLRVLQDGIIERVGSVHSQEVDVRIIAATNVELTKAMAEGRFRSDLFYRLHVFPIEVPPLRERPQDIPLLVRHFIEKNRLEFKRPCQDIDEATLQRLMDYHWPGNIRELENIIERAMILSSSALLTIDDTFFPSHSSFQVDVSTAKLKDLEKLRIEQALKICEWRIDGPLGAAKQLGLNPSTLRSRLKKLGIKRAH